MNPTHQLALNSASTYFRTIVTICLTLLGSRWVLNALGQSDFGLFNLVGSIIVFVTFLNSVMASSVARHFAYSMGRGNKKELIRWFNTALCAHLCLGVLLLLIGWPIGEYTIRNFLNVPAERLLACLWVFRISLISAFINMVSVPFVGMYTAQQRIYEIAFWGVFQSFLILIVSWSLFSVSGDRLLFYALGMGAVLTSVQMIQIYRSFQVFDECKIVFKYWFDLERFRDIWYFAKWTLFGVSGTMMRDQGSAILLNMYYGPVMNASFGVARQVSSATNQLSAAMAGAFAPEITACEGRGDRARMLMLSQCVSKLGTILMILLAVPLIIETEYVLRIWLKTPPEHAVSFCRLILTMFLIDRLSSGHMLAVSAHGKIARYQATLGTILLLTLPIAWLFLATGFAPTFVGVAFIITMIFCSLGRAMWAQVLLGVKVKSWFKNVVIPCSLVFITAVSFGLLLKVILTASIFRFICVVSLCGFITMLAGWQFALDDKEKNYIKSVSDKIRKKAMLKFTQPNADV